jgi:GMP synthase-like glutamine amidotransferase
MRIYCLQHFEPEEAGLIGKWAVERGHEFITVRLYKGDALPLAATPEDGIVIMGGPMNVDEDDKFPWLTAEKAFLAAHAKAGGRLFGVCLGGQLIARSLGAKVTKNAQKEIGWLPVHFHLDARSEGPFKGFPATLVALQWHGDTFAIPAGAKHAASSEVCAHQAFNVGHKVIGLQFHFEAETQEVCDFVKCFDDELAEGGPYVQRPKEILMGLDSYAAECRKALYILLDRWASV